MTNYRRRRIPGGTYFFTVNLADRESTLLVDRIDLLRQVCRAVLAEHPVRIVAMVVLPDHLHAVWTLPPGDADFSGRWQKIKAMFTKTVASSDGLTWPVTRSQRARGERGLWQRRFWEHAIRDEADLERHVAYCWFNPVKHGLVRRVAGWPHSSFHRDVRTGVVAEDWTTAEPEGKFGDWEGSSLPVRPIRRMGGTHPRDSTASGMG